MFLEADLSGLVGGYCVNRPDRYCGIYFIGEKENFEDFPLVHC